jgi:hypothetical protein
MLDATHPTTRALLGLCAVLIPLASRRGASREPVEALAPSRDPGAIHRTSHHISDSASTFVVRARSDVLATASLHRRLRTGDRTPARPEALA